MNNLPENPEETVKELFSFLKEGFNEELMSAALVPGTDGQIRLLIGLMDEKGEFTPMLEVVHPDSLNNYQPWIPTTVN